MRAISSVLNITRIHSCVGGVAALGRALEIAMAYARVRVVGDRPLSENALHMRHLRRIETLHLALLHLVVAMARLLGISEAEPNERDSALLRLLTPVAKAFCATRVPAGIEEAIEALGGQGYQEEVGLGRLLRDALVERLWEGTSNASRD